MKLDHLSQMAIRHTLHCLLGCSIGEILGMMMGTIFALANITTIVLSIILAFFFGYLLTFRSVYKANHDTRQAAKVTLATDTVSITSMEIVDNVILLLIPGAIGAGLLTMTFWVSLAVALAIAFVVTVPVNRFMISRGIGHNCHH